jgi:glycosyltransferase involved in cell wall biosynthesis
VQKKLRTELGIPDGHAIVMYHGAYHPFHGVDTIFAAAELLKKEKISFLLVGNPEPDEGRQPNVYYRSWVPFEELPHYLALADIWIGRFTDAQSEDVRGSRAASSCMFQAMAMGLPVITAHSYENDITLQDGASGVLIAPENPKLLAETIEVLLGDPQQCSRLGAAARSRIINDFSLQGVDTAVKKVMTGVVSITE